MGRTKRIWFSGAVYHIMCRGNRKNEVFRDFEDRQIYLEHLFEAKKAHQCNVLAYCLMTNHVHLLVETSSVEIWKMMQKLNMTYAMYFNKKYRLVGSLFQGRYRSSLIKSHTHNLRVSRYIHLNPVRANLVKMPLDYAWSSYSNYVKGRKNRLVPPAQILGYFPVESKELYRLYVERYL